MVKISVIVPMYNAEKYIVRCLGSIAKQEYDNIEVLCIDDGSTDNTRNVCERYAEADRRFQVYSIKNGGVSKARNYGLSMITGEWFAFVDADDWISPAYLKTLYQNAVEHGCDVSACRFYRKKRYQIDKSDGDNKILFFTSSKESIHNFICPEPSMEGMVWNKLYKTDKFKDIRFDAGIKVREDCIYTFDILERSEKACLSFDKLYYWFCREDSLCHSKSKISDFTSVYVFLELLNRTEKFDDKEVKLVLQKNFINSAVDLMLASSILRKSEDAGKVSAQCREWKKDVWHMLDIKKKCKYILVIHMFRLLNIIR